VRNLAPHERYPRIIPRESFVPSGVAVDDVGRWEWKAVRSEKPLESVASGQPAPRSTFQPRVPVPRDLKAKVLNPPKLPLDTRAGIVTVKYRSQPGAPFGTCQRRMVRGVRAGKTAFGAANWDGQSFNRGHLTDTDAIEGYAVVWAPRANLTPADVTSGWHGLARGADFGAVRNRPLTVEDAVW